MSKFLTLRLFSSLLVAIVFSWAILWAPARAAKGASSQDQVTDFAPKLDSKAPIHITSDRMEANQQAKTIEFEGHVRVRQNDLTITSDRLKVVLAQKKHNPKLKPQQHAKKEATPEQRINYIDFRGNVKITQRDLVAMAKEAIFYQKEQKIVLEGSPVVTKGQDRIEGKLITIYLKDNRCVVQGGRGTQVRAVLFPEKNE